MIGETNDAGSEVDPDLAGLRTIFSDGTPKPAPAPSLISSARAIMGKHGVQAERVWPVGQELARRQALHAGRAVFDAASGPFESAAGRRLRAGCGRTWAALSERGLWRSGERFLQIAGSSTSTRCSNVLK